MTDLFDNLSARFAPNTKPTIRPRPQSRFEGESAAQTISEQNEFETIRSPNEKLLISRKVETREEQAIRQTDAATRPKHQTRSEQTESETRSHPDAPQNVEKDFDLKGRPEVQTSLKPAQEPQQDVAKVSNETGIERNGTKASEHPKPTALEVPTNAEGAPKAPTPASDKQPPIVKERIETRLVPPERETIPETAAQEPSHTSTTIRIGRVEIRQPTPPAPAAAPAAPPKRAAPAGTGAKHRDSSKSGSGSGLTDYLGWKRR